MEKKAYFFSRYSLFKKGPTRLLQREELQAYWFSHSQRFSSICYFYEDFFFYVAFVFFFCIYNCKINGLLICNQNLFGCHIKPKDRVFFEILEFLRSEMGFLVLTNLIDCLTLFIKVLILRLPKIENMTFSLREGRYFAFYVRQVHSLYVQEQRNAIL